METGGTQNRAVFAFGVDPKYGTAFSSSSNTTGVSSTPLVSPHSQTATNNYLQVQNPRNNPSQPNNYTWNADALSSKSSSSTVSPSPSPGVGRLPSRGYHPDGESRVAGGHARSASHSGAVESFLGSQGLLNPQQPLFSSSSSPSGSSVTSPQNIPHHLQHRSLARSGSTSGNVSDNGDSPLSVQSRGLPPGAPGAVSMAAGSNSLQRGSPDLKTGVQSSRGGLDYPDNSHPDPAHNDASSSNSDDGAHHDNQHMMPGSHGPAGMYYGEPEGEQYYAQQPDDQDHAAIGMMAASLQQQQQQQQLAASMGLNAAAGMYGNRSDGFEVNMMNMQGANVGAGMMNAAALMGGDNGLMFPNGNGVNNNMINPAAAALLLRQQQQQQQQQQAQQMMANAAMFNTAICKFYAQGHCGRGEHCNFAHISPTKGMGINVAAATLAAANGQNMMMNQMAMNLGMMQSMDRRDRGRGRDKGRGRFDGNMRGGMNPRNARSMDFRGMPGIGNMNPLDISMMANNRLPRGMPMGPNGSGPSSPNFGQAMTGPAGGSHTRHLSAMNMRSVSTGAGMNPPYFNKGGMGPRSVGGLGMGGSGNFKDKRGFQPNPMYRDGRSPDGRGPMMGGMGGGKMYGSGGKYSPEVSGGMHGRHASAGSLGMMMPYNDDYDSFMPQGDFLSKFPPNPTIEDLTGHIYSLAKDQYGCRLLQKMLDEQKQRVVSIIFKEAFDHMNELMTDPFGNYLCQKLIEHCYENQRLAVIEKVSPDLVAISLNIHGTRAVQKLVETVSMPKEVELVVRALQSSVVTLIKDLNGNHVIQRCLHHLNAKDNQFIYDAVANHLVSVATHKHGCCVLQRCIDYATQKQKKQLVLEIIRNSLELVQDAFGNYVVQYVLDLGENATNQSIIASLLGSVSSLSVQKFSSNVVEKCLELADDTMRSKLIDELTNVERLPRLLQDPYANYVIQRALTVSKKNQFERLVEVIKPHLISLRNTSFGKRIQNKILKKFPDFRLSYEVGMDDPHLMELYHSVQHMQLGGDGDVDDGYAERERQRQMDNPFRLMQQQQQQQQAYMQQYSSGMNMAMMNQSAVDSGFEAQQQQQQMLLQQQQQQQAQQGQFGSYAYGDALEPSPSDNYEQPRSDPDLHLASQLHYGVSDGGVSSSSGSGSDVIQPGGRRFAHHQHSHSLSSANAFHMPAQSPISQVTGSDMPNGSGADSSDQPLAIGSRSSSSSSNVSNNNNNGGAGPTRGPIRVPSASPLPQQQQQQQQQRFGAFPSSTPSHMRHLSGSLLNGQQ